VIIIFVDEPTTIIQNMSLGFDPPVTARASMITLGKESLPQLEHDLEWLLWL